MDRKNLTQMQLMVRSAKDHLRKMDISQIIKNACVGGDEKVLLVNSMNREYKLTLPEFEFDAELEMWQHLTLLQYLFTADGTHLTGRWISLADMPGGLSRGYGFDKDISLMFERHFGNVDAGTFLRMCGKIGGVPADGKADASAVVMYAPRFPVLINFWERDDEFPSSGKVFVDANAHHYLTIEAAGGACAAVVSRLIGLMDR